MANRSGRPVSPIGTSRFERPNTPSTLVASPTSATSNYWSHSKHQHKPSMSAWSTSDTNDDSHAYSTPTSSIYHTPISPTAKGFDNVAKVEHEPALSSGYSADDDSSINAQRHHTEHLYHDDDSSHEHEIDMNIVEPDEWYARFENDQLADSYLGDECPDRATLAAVNDIPIYDCDGGAHTFGSLYNPESAVNQRQLIVFIRHFYCGACQAYLKALTESITIQDYFSIPIPTSIIVIGCGHPNLISFYRTITGTKFPVFAEPSRQLYKKLGMLLSVNLGMQRPEYMRDISAPAWLAGQVTTIRDGLRARSDAKRLAKMSSGFELVRRRNTLKRRGHEAMLQQKRETEGVAEDASRSADSQNGGGQDLDTMQSLARSKSIRPRDVVRGGNLFQIGGEFLFEDGQVIWCHRMRHYRNHVEVSDIRRLLDLDE